MRTPVSHIGIRIGIRKIFDQRIPAFKIIFFPEIAAINSSINTFNKKYMGPQD